MVNKASVENSEGFSLIMIAKARQLINKKKSFESRMHVVGLAKLAMYALDEASGRFFFLKQRELVINFLMCIMHDWGFCSGNLISI